MRVVCSYCGFLYDLKAPLENDDVSHGICEECYPWVRSNILRETEEFLSLNIEK